jgi:P-type conjugative transfer protein TrbJ
MRMRVVNLIRSAVTMGVMAISFQERTEAQLPIPIPIPIPGIPGGGGGIVFDPTNFARNVLHYERRLEEIGLQQQQLEQQLLAMRKLQNPNWRGIQAVLAEMEGLMEHGQALAFTLQAIAAEFQITFPGDQVYRDYPIEQTTQAMRTLATIRGVLDRAQHAARDLPLGLARLEGMKRQLATIQGHEEALELNGTIGVYSAEELTLLRHALEAQTNAEAVYFANRVNAESQAEATVRANLAAMSAPGPRFPGFSLQVVP